MLDSKHRKILRIISVIRDSRPDNEYWYTNGGCWELFKILRVIYPEAKAWYDGQHVVTCVNGRLYDITGSVSFKMDMSMLGPLDPSTARSAHRWSIDRHRMNLRIKGIRQVGKVNIVNAFRTEDGLLYGRCVNCGKAADLECIETQFDYADRDDPFLSVFCGHDCHAALCRSRDRPIGQNRHSRAREVHG